METLGKDEKLWQNWKAHTYKITNVSSAYCFSVAHLVLY